MALPSDFRMTDLQNRIEIRGPYRRGVEIILRRSCFELRSMKPLKSAVYYSLDELDELIDGTVGCLVPPGHRLNDSSDLECDLHDEMGPAIRTQLNQMFSRVEPRVLKVYERVRNLTDRVPFAVMLPQLYNYDDLVNDIISHRAAAYATLLAEPYLTELYEHESETALLPNRGVANDGLDPLINWQAFYSDTGRAYENLTLTLKSLTQGIPLELTKYLSMAHLARPIFNKIELLTFLVYLKIIYKRHRFSVTYKPWLRFAVPPKKHEKVFMFANSGQVCKALELLSLPHKRKLRLNRDNIALLVISLLDYTGEFSGDIFDLTRKAVALELSEQEKVLPYLRERLVSNADFSTFDKFDFANCMN